MKFLPFAGLLLAACAWLAAPAWSLEAASSLEARLARIEAAAAAHPDDPDLAFARAMAQVEAGRREAASASLRAFVARWPGMHPRAGIELGRLLLDEGDHAGARVCFERALERDPQSGPLHFQYALSLRGLGLRREAGAALEAAGRLAPTLEPEILLVQALDLFEAGEEAAALQLLHRILEIDPTGEAARRVRLLLLEREPLAMRRNWRLDAYGGFEYDSNVTLENDSLPTSSEQSDVRGTWGGGVSLRPLHGAAFSLNLGYRYDQTLQRRLSEYDLVNQAGFVSASWKPARRFALRLDGLAFHARLDGAGYATIGSLRPNAIFAWDAQIGTSRLFADVEWQRYDEEPSVAYFERDAEAWGFGLEHYFGRLPRDGWGSLGLRWERTDTHAPTTGQFGGEYDRDLVELRLRVHQPLPWEFEADAGLTLACDDYRYASYFAFAQSFELQHRDDRFVEGRFALSRRLHRLVTVEAAYRGSRRHSDIDAFDYVRHVVGVHFRVTSQ